MVAPGKKKSTFVVDEEIYKRIRILSIERDVDISVIIEEAMREKVQREYPDYKPPVSVLQQQQPQPQQQQQPKQTQRQEQPQEPQQLQIQQSQQPQYQNTDPPKQGTIDPYPNPEMNPVVLNIEMPEIEYPITKEEILKLPGGKLAQLINTELLRKFNRSYQEILVVSKITYDLIKMLPNKKYNSKQELKEAIRGTYNKNDNELKRLCSGRDAISVNISDSLLIGINDRNLELLERNAKLFELFENLSEDEKELISGLKPPSSASPTK